MTDPSNSESIQYIPADEPMRKPIQVDRQKLVTVKAGCSSSVKWAEQSACKGGELKSDGNCSGQERTCQLEAKVASREADSTLIKQLPVAKAARKGLDSTSVQLRHKPLDFKHTLMYQANLPPTAREDTREESAQDRPKPDSTENLITSEQEQPQSDSGPRRGPGNCQTVRNLNVDAPHQTSYFILGKTEGKIIQFLLDSGCTTNILSQHAFERLRPDIRATLKAWESTARLADGTSMMFTGRINLGGRLRDVPFRSDFLVAKIKDDAILGMPFLTEHNCKILFGESKLELNGKLLACTNRKGLTLSSKVQLVQELRVPAASEVITTCRLGTKLEGLGVVEGLEHPSLMIATSLNRVDRDNKLLVRA